MLRSLSLCSLAALRASAARAATATSSTAVATEAAPAAAAALPACEAGVQQWETWAAGWWCGAAPWGRRWLAHHHHHHHHPSSYSWQDYRGSDPVEGGDPERVLLVVHPRHRGRGQLEEALSLAKTYAGGASYGAVQHIEVGPGSARSSRKPSPATYLGSGGVEEVLQRIQAVNATSVFVNAPLSGVQQRNLATAWGGGRDGGGGPIPVLDRVGLIIGIFAQRATTREARLQVELAELDYQASRLVRAVDASSGGRGGFGEGMGTQVVSARERGRSGGSSGGLGGGGGGGERELQLQRRRWADRRRALLASIEEVRKTRAVQREARVRSGKPVVALVGYTNAGKSSLLRALTRDAGVGVANRLFETLDPKLKRVHLPAVAGGGTSDMDALVPPPPPPQQQQQQPQRVRRGRPSKARPASPADDLPSSPPAADSDNGGSRPLPPLPPRLAPRDGVLADTVGFVSDLPHELVDAFRATLEEARHADVLVHVIDASSPDAGRQRGAVLQVLRELGIPDADLSRRVVEAWNKQDAAPRPRYGYLGHDNDDDDDDDGSIVDGGGSPIDGGGSAVDGDSSMETTTDDDDGASTGASTDGSISDSGGGDGDSAVSGHAPAPPTAQRPVCVGISATERTGLRELLGAIRTVADEVAPPIVRPPPKPKPSLAAQEQQQQKQQQQPRRRRQYNS